VWQRLYSPNASRTTDTPLSDAAHMLADTGKQHGARDTRHTDGAPRLSNMNMANQARAADTKRSLKGHRCNYCRCPANERSWAEHEDACVVPGVQRAMWDIMSAGTNRTSARSSSTALRRAAGLQPARRRP
jgi:hypothetical protein